MCKAFRALFAVLEIFLDKSDETQQHFYNDKSTKKNSTKNHPWGKPCSPGPRGTLVWGFIHVHVHLMRKCNVAQLPTIHCTLWIEAKVLVRHIAQKRCISHVLSIFHQVCVLIFDQKNPCRHCSPPISADFVQKEMRERNNFTNVFTKLVNLPCHTTDVRPSQWGNPHESACF